MKSVLLIAILLLNAYLVSAELVDHVVAKVGRDVILRSELENQMMQMEQLGVLTPDITEEDVLKEMIESRLILQTARERNYRLDEHRIRQMIDNQIQSQVSRLGSEEALREELRNLGMSMSDLRSFYEEMIREQRLKEMIIQNEIINRIHVTEAEIEEFYRDNLPEIPLRSEKIELGMIQRNIEPSDKTKRRILSEINRVYDKIRDGEDFAVLAGEHSDCPSAGRGGDLGFFGPGTMIREFEEVAFNLKPGEISQVVETQFGYHIIKMEDRDEDDIRVRHILKMIEPTEEDLTEEKNMMESILLRLRRGEDFQQLAREYSDDESAEQGGIVGEFSEDEFPEMFSEYLKDIDIGEYTDVIREGNHIYIFGKLRLIPERPYKLAEAREDLREYIHTEKQLDHYDRWIDNLWKEFYVEVYINR